MRHELGRHEAHGRLDIDLDLRTEDVFLLAAADGQDAVRGKGRDLLAEVVVHLELRTLADVLLAGFGAHDAVLLGFVAQRLADLRSLGELFGEDVARHAHGGGHVGNALLLGHELGRELFGRLAGGLLGHQDARQRLEASFPAR